MGKGAWSINDKNLDYEIETISQRSSTPVTTTTINDKNLDYEIETREMLWRFKRGQGSINDKNLDYEIETTVINCCLRR